MKKVVLLSGGMDSSTLLYMQLEKTKPQDILALTIDYNQRHIKELISAARITEYAHVPHMIVTAPMTWADGALIRENLQGIPAQSENKQQATIVPGRNAYLLSIAVSVAVGFEAGSVYYGAVLDDHRIYKDCRPDFFDAFSRSSEYAYDVSVFAPLAGYTKAQVASYGSRLHVPYDLTWTCYKGEVEPCMICDACMERLQAFESLGMDYNGKLYNYA